MHGGGSPQHLAQCRPHLMTTYTRLSLRMQDCTMRVFRWSSFILRVAVPTRFFFWVFSSS